MGKTTEKKKYFVVRERAVPEVLLKVVQAKKLLDSEKVSTVQEAAEQTGISRSSFYKYKDDIFPFHEEARGKTITFIIQMDDEPGILSVVLQTIARSMEYPDDPSEYSDQWSGNPHTQAWISCRVEGDAEGYGWMRSNREMESII